MSQKEITKEMEEAMEDFAHGWVREYSKYLAECELSDWGNYIEGMNWNSIEDIYNEYSNWADKTTNAYYEWAETWCEAFESKFGEWFDEDEVLDAAEVYYLGDDEMQAYTYDALMNMEDEVVSGTIKEYVADVNKKNPTCQMDTLKEITEDVYDEYEYKVYTRTDYKGEFELSDIDTIANCDIYGKRVAYIWKEDFEAIYVELECSTDSNITEEMMELFVKIYNNGEKKEEE